MKFSISREALLKPLQLVAGVVERRQTLPILANVLVVLDGDQLALTGTDLEVEIVGRATLAEAGESGEVTVPARKLVDICRSLTDGSTIKFVSDAGGRIVLTSGRSRFTLTTLPANEFPSVDDSPGELEFATTRASLKGLLDSTAFAMAHQDVRYYLNGMLWEASAGQLRVVATDGHRLAMSTLPVGGLEPSEKVSAIVPRKGVVELSRLLNEDGDLKVVIGNNHIRINGDDFLFTSKLVDGAYPDYNRVLPKGGTRLLEGNREELRSAFGRTAILSNEKYRGVRLILSDGLLKMVANNPEQEEAEEEVTVSYSSEELEIGFNVSYILDVLNVLGGEQVRFTFSDANSSALMEDPKREQAVYVIMPMRL